MKTPLIDPGQIKKVVVRGTNWVGDAVMTIPALRELRRILPSAHITLFTPEWSRGIFADADFIDDILIVDGAGVWKQGKALRAEDFDLAVLFTNSFSSAAAAKLGSAKYRVGYKNEGRGFLLTHSLDMPGWRDEKHEIFYYLNIVAELETLLYGESKVLENEPRFELTVSEERKNEARKMLSDAGCDRDKKIVAFCPGSTNSRAKRWQAESYAALADKLKEELDANVVLIGAPDEIDVSLNVSQLAKHPPVMLTGKTSLSQVVAILSVCDLLVSNDTGPAHISAALGKPTLAIFGPTNPKTTRPFPANAEIIRKEVECSPCMLRDCPIDHRCMTRISPDEVFRSAQFIVHNLAE
ncbi:MAG TPA: lipopolysaccharide heptosyltransferase II [Pyrinomonadaceae bacterium]|nr:lipopolysaccharide heptosyltransferase II [Pyrinomonadaceae bacterium]